MRSGVPPTEVDTKIKLKRKKKKQIKIKKTDKKKYLLTRGGIKPENVVYYVIPVVRFPFTQTGDYEFRPERFWFGFRSA